MDIKEQQRITKWQQRLSRHLPPGFDPHSEPGLHSETYHVANHVPRLRRIAYLALAILLLAYGTVGLHANDLVIPSKRGAIHLIGVPAWLMFGAIASGGAGLLSVVIDHYDRRNNERTFATFQRLALYSMYIFFPLALAWSLWEKIA